ncbi:MAG: helix-turn-helix domain-containing protein [Pseudobdellovibrio sp.]
MFNQGFNFCKRKFAVGDVFGLFGLIISRIYDQCCRCMLLNQETLRLVFGLKLKGLRLDRGLSLKELAKKTGLSPSYLNEIEKGKKYPRTEKILILADALNEKLEDLISLELKKELKLIQNLIDKKIFSGMPFDIFGIPSVTIFELIAEHPKRMQALVGTLIELARAHSIDVDDLLYALLRSYLDMHNNYFPSIEEKARAAEKEFKISIHADLNQLKSELLNILTNKFKVDVLTECDFNEISKDISELDFFLVDNQKKLVISKYVSDKDLVFILAREIGYRYLSVKTRPITSLAVQLDSFEQLFNHFSASYFASSLLIPEIEIRSALETLFAKKSWSHSQFLQTVNGFNCTIESFFHRMTQVLPKNFDLGQLFYLRYEYDLMTKKYQVSRELHLSSLHSPHKVKGHEHYCSRWLIHQLTLKRMNTDVEPILGIQHSSYVKSDNEYLVIAASFKKQPDSRKISCVCMGLLNGESVRKKIAFLNSPEIPVVQVGETCERCTLANCQDRKADYDQVLNPNRNIEIIQKVSELDSSVLSLLKKT